jgi:hypothetical protein
MIDLCKCFGASQAGKRLPPFRKGRPVSSSTIIRWIVGGVRGPDGQVVRLEAVRLGGRWVTDCSALRRFAERLTPLLPSTPSQRSVAARRRDDERAARELERRGL